MLRFSAKAALVALLCFSGASLVDAADSTGRSFSRGTTNSARPPDQLVKDAATAYREADYRNALALLHQAEQKAPNQAAYGSENIHNLRGACYVGLRLFPHAQKAFERALKAAPDSFDVKFNLAEIEFLQGRFESAHEKFSALQNSEKGRTYFAFLQFKLAMCLLMLEKDDVFAQSRDFFQPRSANHLFLDAALALRGGETDKADLLFLAAREQLDRETYDLYRDSLIECGLLDPTENKPGEFADLLDAIGKPDRRPLAIGQAAESLPTGGAPPPQELPLPVPPAPDPDPKPKRIPAEAPSTATTLPASAQPLPAREKEVSR